MKFFTTITSLFLFSFTLQAQEPDTSLLTELEEVFLSLDTANLSTNLLFDKTVDLFDINKLQGNGDTIVTNKDIYQLYLQAKNMSFDQEEFISTDSLINKTNDTYGELNPLLITWYGQGVQPIILNTVFSQTIDKNDT